jgi:predicted DCC family thiol-disulfide oxidoreductase YuxK
VDNPTKPILLYNDECGVCRRVARWVQRSGQSSLAETSIIERPIGDDPQVLRSLNPTLDIWEAYETIHLLMPDGSMKRGGEAVAEVLRTLPNTRWFSGAFAVNIFGVRPFQIVLNAAYAVLADVRPLLGCKSCGTPSLWMRPLAWLVKRAKSLFGGRRHRGPASHFTPRAAQGPQPPAG